MYKCTLSKEVPFRLVVYLFYTITSYFTSENFSLRYFDVYDAYAFSQKLKIIIYFFSLFAIVHLTWFFALQLCAEMHIKGVIICRAKKCCWLEKKDVILIRIPFTECRWCRRIPQKVLWTFDNSFHIYLKREFQWCFVTKIVLVIEKKLLKFEAEGREVLDHYRVSH